MAAQVAVAVLTMTRAETVAQVRPDKVITVVRVAVVPQVRPVAAVQVRPVALLIQAYKKAVQVELVRHLHIQDPRLLMPAEAEVLVTRIMGKAVQAVVVMVALVVTILTARTELRILEAVPVVHKEAAAVSLVMVVQEL
jgi:hypothetical protein